MPDLRPLDRNGNPYDKELVDDLAEVLSCTVVGWELVIGHDLAQAPEVRRVMARYRQERQSPAPEWSDKRHTAAMERLALSQRRARQAIINRAKCEGAW